MSRLKKAGRISKRLHQAAYGAVLSVSLAVAGATASKAAFIDAPVPTNTYIVLNGMDWAWAFPLPADSGLDLSYQGTQGWRIPTAAELTAAPMAIDFEFAGANVPLGGSDLISGASFQATNSALTGAAACATPYFSNSFRHCDWQDGNGQPYGPWAGTPGSATFAEQLVIRADSAIPVPEPVALSLLGSGLVGLAVARRKKAA